MTNVELLKTAYENSFDAAKQLLLAYRDGANRDSFESINRALSRASCAVQELCNRASGVMPPKEGE